MNTRTSIVTVIVLILLALLASVTLYDRLPDSIPIHWNIRGEADSFGAKVWAVWLLPGLMALMALLMFAVLPAISPRKFEVETFRSVYDLIVVLMMVLFLVIHLVSLRQGLDERFDGARLIVAAMFVFFAVLGNLMGKIRRNFWMGIRVPWTIASERVWNDTHRVAAWIWVATGLLGALLAWFGHLFASLALLALAVIVPVAYSYVHYRDLERRGELEQAA